MRTTATKLSFSVLVNKLLCLVTSVMLNPKLSSEAKSVSESMDQNDKENELFDPSVTPPFTISEVRAAIPTHCWKKSSLRSMLYFVRDIVSVISLAAFAHFFCKSWWIWVLYWFSQGTFFWAIFVIGHDCGHGSFSDNKTLNSLVGHLAHSFTLVPYNGWRISHKTHHQNHGHVEKDESWNPLPEKMYKSLSTMDKITRFTLPWPLTALPVYLMLRSPGKKGSCFSPDCDLFAPSERKGVIISTLCWLIMASLLVGASILYGPALVIKFYGIPYWVFVAWFCLVTYLNHQGHEHKIPWYRGKEWSYLRGALSTIDRDYGIFNDIHHNIGTHVIHHLFPQIPHYHLIEATEAAKHVLGKYYRAPHKNSVIPVELIKVFDKSLSEDHFVRDEGDIVFYETDYSLYSPAKIILSYMGSKVL